MINLILATWLLLTSGNITPEPITQSWYVVIVNKKENPIATKLYKECMKEFWKVKGKYSCDNLMLTMMQESWFNPKAVSKTNDYWIFQLHYKYHKSFINSKKFASVNEQISYWLWVRKDAKKKNTMPRYGYKVKDKRKNIVKIARV